MPHTHTYTCDGTEPEENAPAVLLASLGVRKGTNGVGTHACMLLALGADLAISIASTVSKGKLNIQRRTTGVSNNGVNANCTLFDRLVGYQSVKIDQHMSKSVPVSPICQNMLLCGDPSSVDPICPQPRRLLRPAHVRPPRLRRRGRPAPPP